MPSLPWRRAAFVAALLVIAALSLMPTPPRLPSALGWDKLQHAAAFVLLALWAHWAWPRAAWRWIWLGLLGYGVGIEVAQSFTPNRVAEVEDVVADLAGIGLGHLLGMGWQHARRARTEAD